MLHLNPSDFSRIRFKRSWLIKRFGEMCRGKVALDPVEFNNIQILLRNTTEDGIPMIKYWRSTLIEVVDV
jgi:hypothetical protein